MIIFSKIGWALFGNDEDGIYGVGTKWNPNGEQTVQRAIGWWFRNPFHNLTHHVIGIFGEPFISEVIDENNPGWSKSVRILANRKYPYWNYRGKGFQFYLGWRSSGAFGVSLRKRSS